MAEFVKASAKRKRLYVCKFDHADAIRRFEAGESAPSIARSVGVTPVAVRRLVKPGLDARMRATSKRSALSGTCESCGGPCMPPGFQGRTGRQCRSCYLDPSIPRLVASP